MTPVTEAFKTADANHDEQLTPEEFAQLPYSGLHFADVDTDRNGSVSLAELRSYVEWRRIATAPPRLDERGGSIRR